MTKSIFSTLQDNKLAGKSNIALICILAMFVGFLVSPALLSISMMAYGANGLRGISPRRWVKDKWWLLGAAWIALYAISYFWSDDKESWSIGCQVKLPFLILPLAFAYTPRFSMKQMQVITFGMGILLLAGVEYSLSFLVRNHDYYLNGYRFSHLLPTPARGDHISFSVCISLYIIWVIYAWRFLEKGVMRWFTGVIIALLILYIHILAAKSGLICLYLFFISWSVYLAFAKRKLPGFLLMCAIPLFLALAVRVIPTFGERKGYVDFSWFMLKSGDRSGNYGDIGRLMSYKLGIGIIQAHPLLGVGTGDILPDMKKEYDKFYPQVADRDRLVPHNQFIIVAVCVGVPGMIIFAIWYFLPLTWLRKNRQSFFFLMTWMVLMVHTAIDTQMEVQMGVFVFTFFILLMREELPQFVAAKEELSQ